jgi:hypothetical protein
MSGVVIEQILSGQLDAPVDYDQDHDEWVCCSKVPPNSKSTVKSSP